MARLRIYVPLSLLTTTTLDRIMLNQSVRYRKVVCGRGAGKTIVDESYFPAEESLQEDDFWQAYKNWIALMEAVSGPTVIEGWHAHHNRMISDQCFSHWFPAWCMHDQLIRLKFTDKSFIIDPKAIAYIQQFECCRTDLLGDLPSTFSLSTTPNASLALMQHGPLPCWQPGVALWYVPYNKPVSPALSFHLTDILCVRCRRIGHQVATCSAMEANRLEWPIIIDWKGGQIISKQGRQICVFFKLFNIRGVCDTSNAGGFHGDHSCSLW